MSSESNYDEHAASESESSLESSHERSRQPPIRPSSSSSSRRQPRTPLTPRKRRRLESIDPARIRKYYLQGKYNDAYRVLYNDHHTTKQIGASTWSAKEQAIFYAALERLGRDNIPGIAAAVGTKTIPETHDYLLLLHDAAAKQNDAKVTLRHIPAAIEIGHDCNEQLDLAGEALAWYQEMFEASQEQEKFGQYWLITSDVAAEIEEATLGVRPRSTSSPPAPESSTSRRGGKVSTGACVSCKKLKQRCDRETPCSNCVRRKIDLCVYKQEPINPDAHAEHTPRRNILDDIPEAKLLQPHIMLTLSKNLFMNRSPTIPSPWPHWSELQSDLSQEPSIYRGAFNDFHTLVLSVTKRLVQTAIVQATSRLRSQRQRPKNGSQPLVKKRDVLTAIDIVGMKRNGKQRWSGVARRCAVRVYESDHRYDTCRKGRKEISWDEVERIMAPADHSNEPMMTDAELSNDDAPTFKSKVARSGTPLPMDQLALSASDDEAGSDDGVSIISGTDSEAVGRSEDHGAPTRSQMQPRDTFGRYASVPPTTTSVESAVSMYTLEQFDQEASRQEEEALWHMLELEPTIKDEAIKTTDDDEVVGFEQDEKVTTEPDGWRSWTQYHADWEEFETPVPIAKFLENQKPNQQAPVVYDGMSRAYRRMSSQDTDTSNDLNRLDGTQSKAAELRARSPRAYAALQETAIDPDEVNNGLFDSNFVSDAEASPPAQSIEDDSHAIGYDLEGHGMDWEA